MKNTKIIFVIVLVIFVLLGAFFYYEKTKQIIVPSDSGIIPAPTEELREVL